MEIIGGQEHGAGLSRTAEIVLVDELRAFTMDLLQEINDRMAAFGGKGRSDHRLVGGATKISAERLPSWRNQTSGNGS